MNSSWVLPQNFKTKFSPHLSQLKFTFKIILQIYTLQLSFILVIFILFKCNVKFIFLATAEVWCSHYETGLSS